MLFSCYRKRGRNWEYLGDRTAEDSRAAALKTSYVHNLRIIGVKPAYTSDAVKLFVYRFKQPAAVHHGR